MSSVVVVGSGAAGLAAALAAHEAGADVTILEEGTTIGGTTALSSGVVWLPNSHVSAAAGSGDSPALARAYLSGLDTGDVDTSVLDRYLAEAPRVALWLEEVTALRWAAVPVPDCYCDVVGANRSGGRSLEPRPLSLPASSRARVRAPLPWRPPATLTELLTGDLTPELLERRRRTAVLTSGQALVTALLDAAVRAGVVVRTSARATRLTDTGLEVDGQPLDGRVVLASGGFERDPALRAAHLGATVRGLIGAPGTRGDGLRMALSAGAALKNTSQAWWCPTLHIPGDTINGEPLYRMLLTERGRPGSLMVDSLGRRFTNEAQSYHEVGRALHASGREPAWLVFDTAYRRRYRVGPVQPSDPDPDWLVCGHTPAQLAGLIGVPDDALAETITRFNRGAQRGLDEDFNRGASAYDQAMGDPHTPHPTLGPLNEPPFYALHVHLGLGGTNGGPHTDADGRILRDDGSAIPGLYGAGNAVASPFGTAYPGTGATLGPALVLGAQAGKAAAGD
ncbi:FAD-dependent oxidoreductase [Streptomyces chartreusis]|uniref:FAD-dependent oxidoreductase n=1 Tax=Streptomyces chartreusis TaxID=1969 RepID=UPI002E192AB0|nr:FAD-dependent oxidoreductase [Streptomyces chartreusis]